MRISCPSLSRLSFSLGGLCSVSVLTLHSCPCHLLSSFFLQIKIKFNTATAAGHGNVLVCFFCWGLLSSLAFSFVLGCLFSLTPRYHEVIMTWLDSPPQEFSLAFKKHLGGCFGDLNPNSLSLVREMFLGLTLQELSPSLF